MNISVVVSAYNEEKKIEDCLKSAKAIADELIVVDNSSADSTPAIAKNLGAKVFTKENNLMLNVNKNFGFSKAKCDWILSLDADERVTDELAKEIRDLNEKSADAFYIPRKNIIFGKWIKNTGWYPDYQLRLFKKGKGKFAEKNVHEMLTVDGTTERLESPILHYNYESVSQFLNKMINTYTISEAEDKIKSGYKYSSIDIVKMPLSEFVKRFFAEKGYKDGMHGLVLSSLQAFYHFIVFVRLWEMNKYPDDPEPEKILKDGAGLVRGEFRHWMLETLLEKTPSPIKKNILRIKSKIHH